MSVSAGGPRATLAPVAAAERLPLVSIIVNNFNYADYVAEAISSALAQDYARIELCVVDDSSTDGSWAPRRRPAPAASAPAP